MHDLRTAAQQALEAIEDLRGYRKDIDEAITALSAALAQEQAEPPGCDHCNHPLYAATRCRVCGRVTEQAEPEQEPVAWIHRQGNHWEVSERHLDSDEKARGWTEEPLYTAPPKLVPLTNEEIYEMYNEPSSDAEMVAFARAVERAHGIGDNK